MVKRRKKASDVFKESEYAFGAKVSFEEAFPSIADLKVIVKEIGVGYPGHIRTIEYTRKNFPGEFVDCSNDMCTNGGFDLGEIIADMVINSNEEREEKRMCQGYEGTPNRRCMRIFIVNINIKYKE